jgi:hypothetical protein
MGQQGLGGMGEHACRNNQKEGLVAVYDLGGGEQGSGGCGRAGCHGSAGFRGHG